MNDWAATAQALQYLEAVAGRGGFTIDRAGVALDRRMGLPVEQRESWPAETGPLLASERDWRELADCARIQPNMGDFMIGQPAAVENTIHALRAGVTTVGNLDLGCGAPVINGGVLNQNVEDNALPVPVGPELKKLGFGVAGSLEQLTACLPEP